MQPTTIDDLRTFDGRLAQSLAEKHPWAVAAPETTSPAAAIKDGSAVAPVDWDDFIGQEKAKMVLRVRIVAARRNHRRLGHVLLADPRPGIGKTALAKLIAADLGHPFIEITHAVSASDMLKYLTDANVDEQDPAVVFIDEAHALTATQQKTFLTFMEPGAVIQTKYVQRRYPKVTLVFATTDVQDLIQPIRSRFQIIPDLEPYTDSELMQMVILMGEKIGVHLDDPTVEALAGASAGSPRQIRHMVEAAADLADTGFPYGGPEILDFVGIEPDGLTRDHLAYLQQLAAVGGACGLSVLASHLGKHERDVRQLERLLFDRGFVYIDGRRVLSPSGNRRLSTGGTA